ncbi:Multidrug resistance-associated protein 6 [Coemansia javaensis]|uniref:Multidrug resistance-associated protein 6 n=1 Tax=Coemansia javaensis TaxID=2761396 RepID=A0A9W8HDX7_9FUNG|nr:Multidrug resistance-associated protein 6 [Coemansia javaensis]
MDPRNHHPARIRAAAAAALGWQWLRHAICVGLLWPWIGTAAHAALAALLVAAAAGKWAAAGTANNPAAEFPGSWTGRVTYHWVYRLLRRSTSGSGGDAAAGAHVPRLPAGLRPERGHARFAAQWRREVAGGRPWLARALARAFARELATCGGLQLLVHARDLAQPVVAARILGRLGGGNGGGDGGGDGGPGDLALLALYAGVAAGGALAEQHQIDARDRAELAMRMALAGAVHAAVATGRRAPVAALQAEADVVAGGTDGARRLAAHAVRLAGAAWAPARLCAGLWVFYRQVGWAVAPGVAVALAYLPLRAWLLRHATAAEAAQQDAAARRAALAAQLLDSAVPVRMLGWAPLLAARIRRLRARAERRPAAVAAAARAAAHAAWGACRSAGPLASLLLYAAAARHLGRPALVTVERVVIVQAVLRQLLPLLADAPHAMDAWHAARAPYAQIEAVLRRAAPEMPSEEPKVCNSPAGSEEPKVRSGPPGPGEPRAAAASEPAAVAIAAAAFAWPGPADPAAPFVLRVDSLVVGRGQLVAVAGAVGAGKSSLLSAILGEMDPAPPGRRPRSRAAVTGRTAYVGQHPWLARGTVRDNVVFGAALDEPWLARVLDACELAHDVARWPLGNRTAVGPGGMALSGGQRMRIALARAVYSRAPVCLVDAALSAVDAHVASRLIDRVLLDSGLLAGTARIVVSSDPRILHAAAAVYDVCAGHVVRRKLHAPLLPAAVAMPTPPGTPRARPHSVGSDPEGGPLDDAEDPEPPIPMLDDDDDGDAASPAQDSAALMLDPVWYVLRLCGRRLVVAHCLTVAAQCAVSRAARLWLLQPAPLPAAAAGHLARHVAWWAADVALDLAAALWAGVAWRRAIFTRSHDDLLDSVARAPLAALTGAAGPAVPLPLSLFTQAQHSVDTQLPEQLADLVAFGINLAFEAWAVAAFHPALVACVAAAVLCVWHVVRTSSAVLRRCTALRAAARPLVDECVRESVAGAVTVRAFGAGAHSQRRLMRAMARHARMRWLCDSIETWIDISMALLRELAVVVVFAIALAERRRTASASAASPAHTALVHTSVLLLLSRLQHLIRHVHPLRTTLASAARHVAATRIPREDAALPGPACVPAGPWPRCGAVVFDDVSARYEPFARDAAAPAVPALRGASFAILPGQHVGIVGRTGAGKSSIAMALLGLLRPHRGRVLVDGTDIARVPSAVLQRRLAVVPQTPYVLPGTLRENLDPHSERSDQDLRRVLALVGLPDADLESTRADTWSAGQKQLLALARALAKRAPILVLDEPTAAVGPATARQILDAIRTHLQGTTVITIAHQIDAVLACHAVLVVADGAVCEAGPPRDLLARPDSAFARMAHSLYT